VSLSAQALDPLASAIDIYRQCQITPNITYLTTNNWIGIAALS